MGNNIKKKYEKPTMQAVTIDSSPSVFLSSRPISEGEDRGTRGGRSGNRMEEVNANSFSESQFVFGD